MIQVKNMEMKRGPECGEDHKPIVVKLEFPFSGLKFKKP